MRRPGFGVYSIVRSRELAERFPTEMEAFSAASSLDEVQRMQMFFRVEAINEK
jgi:hypothetical protein